MMPHIYSPSVASYFRFVNLPSRSPTSYICIVALHYSALAFPISLTHTLSMTLSLFLFYLSYFLNTNTEVSLPRLQ